jgi:hypothetical protein
MAPSVVAKSDSVLASSAPSRAALSCTAAAAGLAFFSVMRVPATRSSMTLVLRPRQATRAEQHRLSVPQHPADQAEIEHQHRPRGRLEHVLNVCTGQQPAVRDLLQRHCLISSGVKPKNTAVDSCPPSSLGSTPVMALMCIMAERYDP